jgi:hypothetical protein
MKKVPVELQTLLCFYARPKEINKRVFFQAPLFCVTVFVCVRMHIHKYLPEESSASERETNIFHFALGAQKTRPRRESVCVLRTWQAANSDKLQHKVCLFASRVFSPQRRRVEKFERSRYFTAL